MSFFLSSSDMDQMLELAAQSNPCSFFVDFQHLAFWGGKSGVFICFSETEAPFSSRGKSSVTELSIKTDFVHLHCSLPFHMFTNSQETRLQPNWSFALQMSRLLQVQGKATLRVSMSGQPASGALKRESSRVVWASKDVLKHPTIVSLFKFYYRTARPDRSQKGSSDFLLFISD